MSMDHYRGAAWAAKELQRLAQAEIDAGERRGATVKWAKSNPAKVGISWLKRRVLLGEFRRRQA